MENNQKILNEIKTISNIFENGKYLESISKAKKLLHKLPQNEFLINITGMSYLKLGYLEDAKNLYLKMIKNKPSIISFKNNYANVLKSLQRNKEAEQILEQIIEIQPNYINAINNLANLKKEMKKYEDAIRLFKTALKIQPENIIILYNIALCYRSIRKFDEVLVYAKMINEIDPKFTLADRIISEINQYTEKNKEHLKMMEDKINDIQLSTVEQVPLYFAIGKAYEDLKKYKLSFENYNKANQLRRGDMSYNFNNDLDEFNIIKKEFNSFEKPNTHSNFSDKKIIFICGMPRSGTTLVEQIISAHPEINSLGETDLIYKILSKHFNLSSKDEKNFLMNYDFKKNTILNEYIDFISKFNISKKIFTDKSLLNFKFVGFIKVFFPNSKIIFLKRDFNNNFLSIFKNDLQGPQLKWTNEPKEIFNYYQLFNDYIKFWNKIFPDYLHEVNYDELVKKPEKISKEMIKYCGLKWNEDCLKYYDKNKSSIDTASVNQANKPIYQSSLNKFENYREFFNFK